MKNLTADLKTRKFVAGVRQVNRYIMENKISKIYLAADCQHSFSRQVSDMANSAGVPLVVCGSRAEFASLVGIDVLCAVIGILKD